MSLKMIRIICLRIFQSTPRFKVVPVRFRIISKPQFFIPLVYVVFFFAAVLHDLALMNLDNKCLKTMRTLLAAKITRWEVYLAEKA